MVDDSSIPRAPANLDAPGWGVEQTGDKREEGSLAGAVRPEKRRDAAGIDFSPRSWRLPLGWVPFLA